MYEHKNIPKGYEIVKRDEVSKYVPSTRPESWCVYDKTYPGRIVRPTGSVAMVFNMDHGTDINDLRNYGHQSYVIFVKPIKNSLFSMYKRNRR